MKLLKPLKTKEEMRSFRIMKMRNPLALHGRSRRAGPLKDRRTPRSGVQNVVREWIEQAEREDPSEKFKQESEYGE